MKTNDLTFTLFSAGLMILLYLALSNLATQEHETKTYILHRPGGLQTDTVQVCDSLWHHNHRPIGDNAWQWMEPID